MPTVLDHIHIWCHSASYSWITQGINLFLCSVCSLNISHAWGGGIRCGMTEKNQFLISMNKHYIKSPYTMHSTLIHLVLNFLFEQKHSFTLQHEFVSCPAHFQYFFPPHLRSELRLKHIAEQLILSHFLGERSPHVLLSKMFYIRDSYKCHYLINDQACFAALVRCNSPVDILGNLSWKMVILR